VDLSPTAGDEGDDGLEEKRVVLEDKGGGPGGGPGGGGG